MGRCHNLKNGEEASADTVENPAGFAEEGKQSEGPYIFKITCSLKI